MGASRRLPVCAGARFFLEKRTFCRGDTCLPTWELRTACLFVLTREFVQGNTYLQPWELRTACLFALALFFPGKTHLFVRKRTFFEKHTQNSGICPWDPSQVVELVFLFNPAPVSAL